jgi:transposase
MKMNVKRAEFSEAEKAEIRVAQKGTYPAHVHRRLLTLKLKALDGMRSDEVGRIVGIHATSVNRIVARYKKEGMEAMTGKRHNHGNRYMSREEEEAFLQEFQRRSEAGQLIETREIHQAYQKAVGHEVTRNMIYYLLHRHKWRKVVPRSRHEKKASEEAIGAYKKNHQKDQNPEKEPAKAARNVPGRGWVRAD